MREPLGRFGQTAPGRERPAHRHGERHERIWRKVSRSSCNWRTKDDGVAPGAQRFGEVVGQDPIVTTLRRAVSGDRLAHAYLFVGPRGTGKTSLAFHSWTIDTGPLVAGQLPRPRASPDSAGADEHNPRRMEHEEGDVQRIEPAFADHRLVRQRLPP